MGGASLDGLTVSKEENEKNGEKTLNIILSGADNQKVKIYEQIDKITLEGNENKEIQFCLKDPYAGPQECAKIFDIRNNGYASELDKYAFVFGSNCQSLNFRPGCVLLEYNEWLKNFVYTGNLCKVEYRDYPISDKNYSDCCLGTTTEECNTAISNDYVTSHCNNFMVKYCEENPDDERCMLWLEKRTINLDDTPLILYNKLCRENHDKDFCTYMCLISRKYHTHFSKYCDDSLIEWCKKNGTSENCSCLNSSNKIVDDFEQYLGPKECWLTQCTLNKQKWKTTEQVNIQKKCNILSCIIDIGKLNVEGNAKIELINNCMAGGLSSREAFSNFIEFTDIKKEQTYGSLFSPFLIFLFFMLTMFLLCYYFDIQNTDLDVNKINRIL